MNVKASWFKQYSFKLGQIDSQFIVRTACVLAIDHNFPHIVIIKPGVFWGFFCLSSFVQQNQMHGVGDKGFYGVEG